MLDLIHVYMITPLLCLHVLINICNTFPEQKRAVVRGQLIKALW